MLGVLCDFSFDPPLQIKRPAAKKKEVLERKEERKSRKNKREEQWRSGGEGCWARSDLQGLIKDGDVENKQSFVRQL